MTQREETANKTIQTRAFSLLSLIAPHSSCCDFISLLCAFSCAFLTHSHPLTDSSSPSCSFNPNPTAIMNGEGEKTCPLCAEDMDLTDQQLKPCTCGYEICVWCWHHLMDMAEKDDTDGRCPACRVPYDKEKIVGMAAKCERLVAEMSMEKKGKSQKAKAKSSDGRKQLCSVRVIQRNLVYIIGLPLNLADEDLLQHREYFGQYGKVLKVSMSRTATGVIQQFPNNTCSVYITYAKEEEAIRCIENAHGFLLDGRSLRACFGTTKYCHAWLRNVPCTNSDCLYLHEIGTQEDSFTKDEIVSAYTRSRVQQITGAANNVQRRSGNVLPPPLDDYCVNGSASSGKQSKMSLTSTGCIARDSHPKGSSGRSVALPATAAWGMCGANGQKLTVNTFSNGPSKQKPDTTHCMLAFSCTTQASTLDGDGGNKQPSIEDNHPVHAKVKPESLNNVKLRIISDHQVDLSETAIAVDGAGASNLSNQFSDPQELKENDTFISLQPSVLKTAEQHGQSSSSHCKKEQNAVKGWVQNLCLEVSSVSMISDAIDNNVGISRLKNSSDNSYVKSSPQGQGLPEFIAEQYREPSAVAQNKSIDGVYVSRDQNDRISDVPPKELIEKSSEFEDDVISFDNQRLKDPEVVTHSSYLPNSINGLHSLSQSRLPMKPHEADGVNINSDNLFVDNKVRDSSILCMSNVSMTSNGYPENIMRSSVGSGRTSEQHSFLHPTEGTVKQMGRLLGDAGNVEIGFVDKGESSIISNILSMDFDTWGEDEPLTSPQNLAKLLGDGEKLSRAQKLSSSWKGQTNNQSRFSFARQEESINQTLKVPQSQNTIGPLLKTHSSSHDVAENRDSYFDKVGIRNGFSTSNFEDLESCASNQLPFSSNKLSVSRAQISAPPGFSVPNRAPPPGFSSHERVDQAFDSLSGKSMLDSSSLLRDAYQPKGNIADIELMDPAILAVGKERLQGGLNNPALEIRSSFPSQLSPFENDARLQLLMQRSISSQQSLRFPDIGDNFSHFNESYGISSRLVDHSQANNLSHFVQMSLQQPRNGLMSNGHWNEVQGGNTVSMTELPRNERLGFNKSHDCYGGSKFWRSTSGDLYSRTFGI